MKTNIEVRIYVGLDVILETGYSESEIKDEIMKHSFNDFKFNELNIIELPNGEEISVLPYFNIYNDLLLAVSYF